LRHLRDGLVRMLKRRTDFAELCREKAKPVPRRAVAVGFEAVACTAADIGRQNGHRDRSLPFAWSLTNDRVTRELVELWPPSNECEAPGHVS
jgi:hypothetical protein